MPEYLAPGVYINETSFRARSIEGVSTSTAGFVGPTRYGPVGGDPVLITSELEFQRVFGGDEDLVFDGSSWTNHMAKAVRAFFQNGGKRVFVSRIFNGVLQDETARVNVAISGGTDSAGALKARFPGKAGNLRVKVFPSIGANASKELGGSHKIFGLQPGDLVYHDDGSAAPFADLPSLDDSNMTWVVRDASGQLALADPTGSLPSDVLSSVPSVVRKLSLSLRVEDGTREDNYTDLSTSPLSTRYLGRVLRTRNSEEDPLPEDPSARIWFEPSVTDDPRVVFRAFLARVGESIILEEGGDGKLPDTVDAWEGSFENGAPSGLLSLEGEEDISIVAAPGSSDLGKAVAEDAIRRALIAHCERLSYRFAILSGPRSSDLNKIREIRAAIDSKYAALYYPWVRVGAGRGAATLDLPPEGFVAGIYARSDNERGVHKAPANEILRGALGFTHTVTHGQQEILNPEGINCLRFFEGRGHRVWGARTISSDPEWKYVNVRRLFIFLERSIDRSTQWAVFEPNNEALWLNIRVAVTSFLETVWKTGALMGTRPEEAFFVRCDRTTMTQNDIDNGRCICLVGVAPTKPAEFVVFRIGQWTADSQFT